LRARVLSALMGAVASVAAPSFLAAEMSPEPLHAAQAPTKKDAAEASDDGTLVTRATLRDLHSGESFVLDDRAPTIEELSTLLEDRVTGSRVALDPKLLDLLRRISAGRDAPRIDLVSGYRSPKLNEMLRKKEHHVASHSQHSLGHAIDFRVSGMTPKEMRRAVEALGWRGGIGQYDAESDRFVHCDVGPDRRWHER
jgi:uncharacterized protein YcbK (DUF882 family)